MNLDQKQQTAPVLHFDVFTLDLEGFGLYCGSQRIRITPKPLETLIFLVKNQGRVVEKQELLDVVWKDTFVTEDNLVHAVKEIRRVLKDDKDNPRFIQTIPRQGYRFVCRVTHGDGAPRATDDGFFSTRISLGAGERRLKLWLWLVAPVLASIVLLAWVFWPPERTRQRSIWGGIKQVTTGEFPSAKPAFSPDGKFILYISSSQETRGHGDLFVRQFPDGNPLRITNKIDPSGDIPIFTADGSSIAFSVPRLDEQGVRHHDLWTVLSSGGLPRRLINDASGAGYSPDGKWVAYTKHLPSRKPLWVSPVNDLSAHLEVTSEGYTPRWSPDGGRLAYTTSDPNGGEGDLWVCRFSGSKDEQPQVLGHKQITQEYKQIYGLTWAATGDSLIFASKRSGSMQLYQVSAAGDWVAPVLSGVGRYEVPSASPDGTQVIFSQYRLSNDLRIMTLGQNGEAESITFNQFHLWPRLSPSGEKLASILRQADHTERLYLTDLKTKASLQITDRLARDPCWLDEENIAFLSTDSQDKTEVLIVNAVTRQSRLLTVFPGKARFLALHPGKEQLAVVLESPDSSERLILRDLRTQNDKTIHEGSEYEYLRWSPDGTVLAWNKPGQSRNAPHESGGIWLLEMSQSEPRLIAKSGYRPVFSGDGTAIYFTIRNGPQGLWQYDLRRRKEQLVRRWGRVFDYDISGRRVAFTLHTNDSQIYSISSNQQAAALPRF